MKPETSWQTGLWTQSVFQTPRKVLLQSILSCLIYMYIVLLVCCVATFVLTCVFFFFKVTLSHAAFILLRAKDNFPLWRTIKTLSPLFWETERKHSVSICRASVWQNFSVSSLGWFVFCPFYMEFVDRDQNRKVLSFRQDILLAAIMTWLAESSSLVVLCCILLTKFLLRAIMQDPKNTQS